jgi:Zn-dependent metalloprotease
MTKITEDIGNGLKCFSLHSADKVSRPTFTALAEERALLKAFTTAPISIETTDPETAARRYLNQALESNHTESFVAPSTPTAVSQFKVIGTETVPITATRTVKFRQSFHDIPVYGSLVTVELDEDNTLVSINSALGDPVGVKPVAKISAVDALKAVISKSPYKKQMKGIAPRLNYYFEAVRGKWRLAFIFEDVPVTLPRDPKKKIGMIAPRYFDYVVDAQTGRVIAELPRTSSMVSEIRKATDAKNVEREIRVETDGVRSVLYDTTYNVSTYDFEFGDPNQDEGNLPGNEITPDWPTGAVSAHANAAVVARFLREVVKRNNIDDRGGIMTSSVNCVVIDESPDGKQWFNAYWNGTQMVYGQIMSDGELLTLASAIDIVAHEMFHGVTDNTSRLEYAVQSGALNESYSDIFGVIIANWGEPDPNNWDWRLGTGFASGGDSLRDVSDPALYGQPAHMRAFKKLPNRRADDWGGVHSNSGIHNKAAYLLLTAMDANGLVFTPEEVAAIFYLTVTQQLSRTSQFAHSRNGALISARSLFRNAPTDVLERKISAVEAAFDGVGIE